MGIIYMDFYYNRRDDMILSMSPLVLLFFITQVDDVLKYLIVAMIVSNVTYWNCKNIYTFTLDSLFATMFIAYLFYKCMKLKQNLYVGNYNGRKTRRIMSGKIFQNGGEKR